VAAAWHTFLLLGIIAGWSGLAYFSAEAMRAAPNPSRVPMYLRTTGMEWVLTGYVVWGVRRHGGTIHELIGGRWTRVRDFFRDVGIAAVFWLGAILVLKAVAVAVGTTNGYAALKFLLPQGRTEMALWVVMSLTAGFCEELIFRGYLQRQFAAWTGSAAAGIVLSALAFGAGHVYQSGKSTVVLFVFGLLFGGLAQWRRSLRPGMMAHAWQDTLAGLVGQLVRR